MFRLSKPFSSLSKLRLKSIGQMVQHFENYLKILYDTNSQELFFRGVGFMATLTTSSERANMCERVRCHLGARFLH
jgi:hypothetical protein